MKARKFCDVGPALMDLVNDVALGHGGVRCDDAKDAAGKWFLFRFDRAAANLPDFGYSFTAAKYAIRFVTTVAQITRFEMSLWPAGSDIPAPDGDTPFGFAGFRKSVDATTK